MVMSFGGKILSDDRKRALFDQPAGIASFKLISDLVKSGAAYQVDRESYGDNDVVTASVEALNELDTNVANDTASAEIRIAMVDLAVTKEVKEPEEEAAESR